MAWYIAAAGLTCCRLLTSRCVCCVLQVCGGGPRLALWHLRSLTQAAVCDLPAVVHVARFHDGLVLAGGDAPDLHQFTLAGERAGSIPTDCTAVFTVLARTQPSKVTELIIKPRRPAAQLC